MFSKHTSPWEPSTTQQSVSIPQNVILNREAILKRIMQWVDDPSNQAQIMWKFGPAGAGKFAIAQNIADFCF